MKTAQDLIDILVLEELGDNTYLGVSKDIGSPRVFGGQVLAQALNAAYRTVSQERVLHSLHSYFLLPGNLEVPITFKVNEMRNGRSFSTRRVTALQNEETIFILAASFHKIEKGHEHQIQVRKNIKQPETLLSWSDMLVAFGDNLPKSFKTFLEIDRPVEFKPLEIQNPLDKKNLPPVEEVWFKLKGAPDNMPLPLKQQG